MSSISGDDDLEVNDDGNSDGNEQLNTGLEANETRVSHLSLVDGKPDDRSSSDVSKTDVASSSKEKDNKQDLGRKWSKLAALVMTSFVCTSSDERHARGIVVQGDEQRKDVAFCCDSDGEDDDKFDKSINVTEASKVFASGCGALLSFVSGRTDIIASSDKSKTGVTSSIGENIQEGVGRK